MSIFDTFARPACADTLGWQFIDADRATGTVRVAMTGRPAFCNPAGHIQGGFFAAMLDDTLGPALLVASGGTHYGVTIALNISYLAAAAPGLFTGIGRVVRMGRTIAFLEGELFDATGGCVARATASARLIPTTGIQRAQGHHTALTGSSIVKSAGFTQPNS